MAEKSDDSLLKFEQQLTCPVCLELFKNPKVLPCHHVFCQDCLGNFPQKLKDKKYFLICPICRELALLPDGGVAALPPAFIINNFLELHQELLAKQDTTECGQHKRPLELFCSTCQELVCLVCAVRFHTEHKYHLISDIIHDYKKQLKEGLQPGKKQLAVITDYIKILEECDDEVTKQGEAIEQQIHSHAQEARTAIDQAEKMLKREVCITVQHKKRVLSLQKEEAKNELVRLQSSLAFVEHSLAVRSDQQIVASKKEVLDGLNKAVSQQEKVKFNPAEIADMTYKRDMEILDHCKILGILDCSFLHEKCQLTPDLVAVDREACCELLVQQKDGSSLPISTSLISCQLTASRDPQPTDCTIRETGPGKYTICYTPKSQSLHQLRVNVGGSEIPGSIFSIPVLPPTPEARGQPLCVAVKGLIQPAGVVVSRSGQVIVSESGSHCIKIFSNNFRLVKSVGSEGSGFNQFCHPEGLAVTSDNRILVADSHNHRIQVLTTDGQFLECTGKKGSDPLQFRYPVGIIVHSNGKILVSEYGGHRIQVLNSNLSFSHIFGRYGFQQQMFDRPYGMAVDSRGIVYIADSGNNRIQKYSIAGQYQEQIGSQGHTEGRLWKPFGVAIDTYDLVHVSEFRNKRISVFSTTGKFIKCFGRSSQEHVALNNPCGLTFDESGNLYLCNFGDGQLVVF